MLVLIVGPQGAGKDTLLDAIRPMVAGNPTIRIVSRAVTRHNPSASETSDALTDTEFERLRDTGAFALSWRVQGRYYGIPADIVLDLDQGHVVIAKVSRAIIPEAAARFPIGVVEITAPTDVLARRLLALGHEDAVDIARRMSRAAGLRVPVQRETVVNDGTVEQGARKLLDAINRVVAGALLS